jgi:hypothetical protein
MAASQEGHSSIKLVKSDKKCQPKGSKLDLVSGALNSEHVTKETGR